MTTELKNLVNTVKFRKATKTFFQVIFLVSILIASFIAEAKTLRVAIIDTGINSYLLKTLPICGTLDLTEEGMEDAHGHGSHIAATIASVAKADYCLVIIKYFHLKETDEKSSVRALEYILSQNIDIVNYSGGGVRPDKKEKELVLKLLDKGVIFNAAAGNEAEKLTETNCFYPACYDPRINVIGAINDDGTRLSSSSYGPMLTTSRAGVVWAKVGPGNMQRMKGTSQATALFTGETINGKTQVIKETATTPR